MHPVQYPVQSAEKRAVHKSLVRNANVLVFAGIVGVLQWQMSKSKPRRKLLFDAIGSARSLGC